MVLEYRVIKEYYSYFNPMTNAVEESEIEIRFDPLTKKPSRIVEKPLPISENPDITEDVKRDFCPFCDENVEKVVVRDVKVLNRELLKRGEAILFANLTPYADYSLVIRISRDHYIPLKDFKSELFVDAFYLAREYLRKVDADFATLMMNYLKPAGSSIVHPHLQLVISKHPLDYQQRIIDSAKEYYEKNKRNFWEDLIKSERNSDRFIADNGFFWYAPFAPRGFDHVSAIKLKSFVDFDDNDFKALADGIVRVFKAYSELGYNSINFGIFIPLKEFEYLATTFDIVARSNLDKFYWCDVFTITKLFDEAYTNKKPEETAKFIKKFF